MVVSCNDEVNSNQPGVQSFKGKSARSVRLVFLRNPQARGVIKPGEVDGGVFMRLARLIHDRSSEGRRVVRSRQRQPIDEFVRPNQPVVGRSIVQTVEKAHQASEQKKHRRGFSHRVKVGVFNGQYRIGRGEEHRGFIHHLVEIGGVVLSALRHALREATALLDVNALVPAGRKLGLAG